MKKRARYALLLWCAALLFPCRAWAAETDAAVLLGAEEIPAADADLNCHQMAELWFGASLLEAEEPGTPEHAASAWFARREADYFSNRTGTTDSIFNPASDRISSDTSDRASPLPGASDDAAVLMDAPAGDEAVRDVALREAAIEEMQAALEIAVTDADVTARVDRSRTRFNPDGTVTLYAYEWTFLDYDDLSDGYGGRDVAGFGVWHKLTMEPANNTWRILRDEYDATDVLGVCTVTEESRADADLPFPEDMRLVEDGETEEAAQSENGQAWSGEEETGEAELQSPIYYEGYNPDAAAAYADKYTLSYNPDYPNYNPVGGDCANFTSQSIYAGGMPMVNGASGWYHRTDARKSTNSPRSASWTFARVLCEWMGANRGLLVTASDTTVYKGSPVFYNNKGHATICVGQNSAGRPIIDSHNADRYHVPWNYWVASTIYTVQLTGGGDIPLSIVGERYPSGLMGKGFSFGLRGVIRSTAGLVQVSADILDAGGVSVLHYEQDWDGEMYDIQKDGLNDDFVFDNLGTGSYTYVVRARDADGADLTLIESSFTVAGSELSIREETYPSGTLRKGRPFNLAGIISSNFTVTKINAYIYTNGSADTPVMSYERNWSDTSYNIARNGLDAAFIFNNLNSGSYVYTVSATDASGTSKQLIYAPFSISALSNPPAAPTVSAEGGSVTLSWAAVDGADYYEAVLSAGDDSGVGEALYSRTTDETSCVIPSVPPGTYQGYVIAWVGQEFLQSPSVEVQAGADRVTLSPVSTQYSDGKIAVTFLLGNGGGDVVSGSLAIAAYQGDRMIGCIVAPGLSVQGGEDLRATARIPCEQDVYTVGGISVKLFFLDAATARPVTDAVVVEV